MSRRRVIIAFLVAIICSGLVLVAEIFRPAAYDQADLWLRDAISRHGRTASTNPDLFFLAIDNDSITLDPTLDLQDLFSSGTISPDNARALQLMSRGWPWNREVYALILDRLIGSGAKAVVFDCFFAETGLGDDKLHQALDRYRGQAVIGSNFVTARDVRFTGQTPSRYDLPTSSIVPASTVPDQRIGFTNFFADENHVIRGAQYRIRYRHGNGTEATYLSLAAHAAVDAGYADAVPADLAEHLIRFAGQPRIGFKPHSIYEIFVPDYWSHNYRSGEAFRNKIVIVGGEGSWQKDELMTPMGLMPGAELHLNALNALLSHDFLKQFPVAPSGAVIVIAALIAAALCLKFESLWIRVVALAAGNVALLVITIFLYNSLGLLFPALGCAIAWDSTVAVKFVCDLAFERLEKRGLKTTLKARQDLTNMIVHDLRSPLTIVTGYMGMLQNTANEKLGQNESQFVNAALTGANRMNDMITTLLDVERLESGQMPLRFSECNLGELIEQTGARFAPVLGNRKIEYAGLTDSVVIDCDPDVIRRVIENLVNNSIKYTRPDGRIEISVVPGDEHVTMCVADDGVGIPIDQRERIFEKFGQIDGGGKHRHSTGLGLTFCRLAVEGHGGRIWVDETKLGGSTFVFTLPIRPGQIEPTALQSKSPLSSQRI